MLLVENLNYIVSHREDGSITTIPKTFTGKNQAEINRQKDQFERDLRKKYTIITKSMR